MVFTVATSCSPQSQLMSWQEQSQSQTDHSFINVFIYSFFQQIPFEYLLYVCIVLDDRNTAGNETVKLTVILMMKATVNKIKLHAI